MMASGRKLTPDLLGIVAGRFKALGEPARLQILNALRDGEATVTEIIEATGLGQANVSKHLQILHGLGFVARRRDGLFIYYALADDDVFRLCDIVCGRIEAETSARRKVLASR
jgi:DNA-binding transcriptional ArsR family regulator